MPVADGQRDEPPDDEHRSNPWPWIALLVALLLAGGGVAAYLLTRPTKAIVPKVVLEQRRRRAAEIQNAASRQPDLPDATPTPPAS